MTLGMLLPIMQSSCKDPLAHTELNASSSAFGTKRGNGSRVRLSGPCQKEVASHLRASFASTAPNTTAGT